MEGTRTQREIEAMIAAGRSGAAAREAIGASVTPFLVKQAPPEDFAWQLLMGGTLGWLASPLLWVVLPLPIFWVYLMATARQESNYGVYPVGLAGEVGALHFSSATWARLSGSTSGRESVRDQGYYFARELQGALLGNLDAWWMAVPVFGFTMIRGIWRAGPGVDWTSAEKLASQGIEFGGWQVVRGYAWLAVIVSVLLPVILAAGVACGIAWYSPKWRKKIRSVYGG